MQEDAVPFDQLANADLILDRVYLGGSVGNFSDDPLGRIDARWKPGRFQIQPGSVLDKTVRLAVLYTSGEEIDGPITLNRRPATSPTTATTDAPESHCTTPRDDPASSFTSSWTAYLAESSQ